MRGSVNRGLALALGLGLGLGLTLGPSGSGALAQTIEHHPAPCMDTESHPLVEAEVSGPDAGRLMLRFKADDDSDWYETTLSKGAGSSYRAALPKPYAEAVRVRYYISSSEEVRTPEFVVNVLMGGCPGARAASPELGEGIHVRRTSSQQSEIPRGFSPDGIRVGGTMSQTTLGIVAGAAGGATVAAIAVMGEDAPPIAPPPESPQAIRPCFTPDPIPDIDSGETILFDASCSTPVTVTSYQWNFGDGTTGQGTSIEHRFFPGGLYSVTLTVSDGQRSASISRLVRARATPSACFTTIPNPPRIRANESISFNAECSAGDRDGGPSRITLYAWDFGDGRPGSEGRFVSRQFTRPDVYGVTLSVTNDDGRVARTTQFVVVERPPGATRPSSFTFTSHLELPPGTNGQLTINDAETLAVVSPSPNEYRASARSGENVVDARLLADAREGGRWRFDFRNAAGFVPGSIRVVSGDVLTLDASSVVFRVAGASESDPPVRFRFRLEE
jgi:PKD repeat protein